MDCTLASLMRIKQILDSDATTLIVIGTFIVGGILLFKLIDAMQTVAKARQQEVTRREVAAYVAEGTMTPEAAEKVLGRGSENTSWETQVAELLSLGTIDVKEAERLLKSGGEARLRRADSAPASAPTGPSSPVAGAPA